MKRFITFLSVFLISSVFMFAQEKFVTVSLGLASGVPFYGSTQLQEKIDNFENKNNRVVVGTLGSLNLNIAEEVTFFGGIDFISDFNWTSERRCNVLTLDLSSGIKVYPNLGGFNIGLAYVLGYRADYAGLRNTKVIRTKSPWGNGFKVNMEYNFAHDGDSKFMPSIGLSWKRMPRGENKFDNQLIAYGCINL